MRIGVFDSGVGGLTVLQALYQMYPGAQLIYFGDSARVPYGNKSSENIVKYSLQSTAFLLEKKADLIVVACNTSTAVALDILKETFRIPIFGVIEPAVREASKKTRSKKVGVLGTFRTIDSLAYQKNMKSVSPDVHLIVRSCPLFVPMIEEGIEDRQVIEPIIRYYLDGVIGQVDTLLLGCTHYPLIKQYIGDMSTSIMKKKS